MKPSWSMPQKPGPGPTCAVALLLVLLTALPAAAHYMFRRFVPLHDVRDSGASGEVLIEPYGSFIPGQRTVGIDVYRLRPNSVYTVWLSNEAAGPVARRYFLGVGTNSFRTNGAGYGRYVTTSDESVLEDWRFIEIDYHPDGDPRNTKDMARALVGDMVYGYHS